MFCMFLQLLSDGRSLLDAIAGFAGLAGFEV